MSSGSPHFKCFLSLCVKGVVNLPLVSEDCVKKFRQNIYEAIKAFGARLKAIWNWFSKQEVEADWNTSSLFLFSMQIEIGFKSLSSKCGETPVPHK